MKSITIRQLLLAIAILLRSASVLVAQPVQVSDIVPLGTGVYINYNQYDTAYSHAKADTSHSSFTVITSGITYKDSSNVSVVLDSLGHGDPTGVDTLHYHFNTSSGDLEVFADSEFLASQIPSALAKNVTDVPNKWVNAYVILLGTNVSYPILTVHSTTSISGGTAIPVTITITGAYLGTSPVQTLGGNYSKAYKFALIGNLSGFGGLVNLTDTETDWLAQGVGIVKTQLPIDSINLFGNPISVGGRAKEMTSFGVKAASVSQFSAPAPAIRFYPDPASDEVTLALGQPAKQIFLYDAAGRMVRSFDLAMHNGEAMLYVKDIPNGVYLARVLYADGTFTSQQIAVRH